MFCTGYLLMLIWVFCLCGFYDFVWLFDLIVSFVYCYV